MAASLKRSGFATVLAADLDKTAMDATTITFARAARTADVAMFYYSGHAMQFGGVNYLVPVDAKLTDEAANQRLPSCPAGARWPAAMSPHASARRLMRSR